MKKEACIAVILCLGLSGCEITNRKPYPPAPLKQWYKQGASNADVRQSLATCKYDVGMNKVPESQRVNLIISCMEKDGYSWQIHPDDKEKWNREVDELKRQGYSLYWPEY